MLYLFNKNEVLIHELSSNMLASLVQVEELNKLMTLEFSVFAKYKNLMEDCEYVAHKDMENPNRVQMYRVVSSESDDYQVNYEAVHIIFDELKSYGYIREKRPDDVKATAALDIVLAGSRRVVGSVDDSPLKSLDFYDSTRLEALSQIISTYRMDLSFYLSFDGSKISGRYVNLQNFRGEDTGERFVYGSNALEVVRELDKSEVYTRLIPRGKGEEKFDEEGNSTGGYGRRIQITDVDRKANEEVPIDKPKGQEYLELTDMTEKFGFSDGEPRTVVKVFEDITDPVELLKEGYAYLVTCSRPLVQFKTKVYKKSRTNVGDIVRVIRKDLDIYYRTRIYKAKRDLLAESVEVEFGDKLVTTQAEREKDIYKGLNDLNNAIAESREAVSENNSYIRGIQDELTRGMFNEDGYNYELKAGNEYGLPAGYYSFDREIDDNPTKVIYVGAGKLAIANSKKSNGDRDFRTFGTGDGFTADLLIAGMIKGGKVRWNLEDGTFIIGDDADNYSMYRDGSTLHMRNVDIDLENNADIQELKDKYGVTDEEIAKAKGEISQAKNDIEKAKGELASAKESLDKDIEKLHQEDKFLSDTISENKESQDRQNEVVDEKILDLSTKIQVTDGKINTEVSSLRESIERIQDEAYDDSELRKYISEHYSTIEQTDSKIETKVSSVKKDVTNDLKSYSDSNLSNAKAYTDSKDSSVRNYIQSNYSTISQTDDKIASEVGSVRSSFNSDISDLSSRISQTANSITSQISSVKKEISSGDQDVMNYISNNYTSRSQTESMISSEVRSQTSGLQSDISDLSSRISQTANEISSKVSKNGIISAINQSAERIKIDADRIELKGTASMEGTFVTIEEGDGHLVMQGDLLGFVDGNYSSTFGAISVVPSVKYNRKGINIMHNDSSFVLISKGSGGSSDPYVVFDAKGNSGLYKGYDYSSYPVFFSKGVKFGNQGVSFWMDNDDAMILKVIKYSDGTYALRLSYLNNWYIEFRNNGDLVSKRYGESAKKLN